MGAREILTRYLFPGMLTERLLELERRVNVLEVEKLQRETDYATAIADLTSLVQRLRMREVRALRGATKEETTTGLADIVAARRNGRVP
jgi:hypothetical protein